MPTKAEIAALASEICGSESRAILRVKAIHDWIILNTAYDFENFLLKKIPSESYRATGVVSRGVAVCAGYSDAAAKLLNAVDIEATTVSGRTRRDGGGGHAWNMVKLDGQWYHLDVTWDDPVPDEPGRISYAWFLVSTFTISETRSFGAALPNAPDDYLSRVDAWDGGPVAQSAGEVADATRRLLREPGFGRGLILWRVPWSEAEPIISRELKRAVSRETRGYSWTGGDHYWRVFLRGEGGTAGVEAGIHRPWFRLWNSDKLECLTLTAKDGEAGGCLDRRTAKVLFPSVRDSAGQPLHKYFPSDGTPLLRFRYEGERKGWVVSGPAKTSPETRNHMVVNGERVGPVGRRVCLGDRFRLHSWRRGGLDEGLVLVVTD